MNPIRFFTYQFFIFFVLLLVNFFADQYISSPFSLVDFIAICMAFPIFVVLLGLVGKLYRRFHARLRNKVLLTVISFCLAITCLGVAENMWFG